MDGKKAAPGGTPAAAAGKKPGSTSIPRPTTCQLNLDDLAPLRGAFKDGRPAYDDYQKGERWTLNPLRADGHCGSFSIRIMDGVWKDFASGEKGNLVTLARALGKLPTDFVYRDAGGRQVATIHRKDTAGGKVITKTGDRWPEKRPLYRLADLIARPTAPVLVVEGERKAELAAGCFPDLVVVSWPHGAESIDKADLSPLKGRQVILWPDNDDPGHRAMEKAAELIGTPCRTVRIPASAPARWDVADALAECGDDLSSVRKLIDTARDGKPDPIADAPTFRDRQTAVMPDRTWFWEGAVTPGFNMLVAKKGMYKSFLMAAIADAIGEGKSLLGRATTKAPVLFVSFELDERDLTDRFRSMPPLSENVRVMHTWNLDDPLSECERAMRDHGFKVVCFDTFLPLIPQDGVFKVNEYGDTRLYLQYRMMAKRHEAAILASWHEGKAPRDDFMLAAIGSTGMVGQADCVISIDRRRGDTSGKILIGGNHAPESAIPFMFDNGMFIPGESREAIDRLTPTEVKVVKALEKNPEGLKTSAVAFATGQTEGAARVTLNRLEARGKVSTVSRGIWAMTTLKL